MWATMRIAAVELQKMIKIRIYQKLGEAEVEINAGAV
jgi:hypothetical protein